ncbi:Kelch motif-containing protein [Flaviramulus basaltis]|uniref:Kelch motif-containing protein n=1 Tax=Flaviramulus basaltis TaxID=369401 RepID=A0A1K2IDL9_9FLAO|nr:kelch repeat-containing protein [Flaviramulus basaltis]SFZ90489.1 Kelch motif-containing protein [Flaviramulus basaltis]
MLIKTKIEPKYLFRIKLFSLLLFSTYTLFSQNIKGIVLDQESKKPLENVNIYINKPNNGTTSNEKGEFYLNSNLKKSDTIFFSILGYSLKKHLFSELKNSTIYLSKKTENLNEIFINSNIKLNSNISFKKLSSIKTGRHSFASSLVGSKIYVIGGDASNIVNTEKKALNDLSNTAESTFEDFLKSLKMNPSWENYKGDLQVYDITKDTWQKSDLKFRKRAYNTLNCFDNKLYIIGGKSLSVSRKHEYLDDKIEVLDLKNNTIVTDDTNPHQAVNFESFIYNDNIIVMGGSVKLNKKGKKVYTNKSHIYNLETGYWYELNDMPKAMEAKGLLIKNKIYLIGGFNDKPLSEIESYNILTGEWTKEGNLFYGIEKPALTYNQNVIYIFNDGKLLTYNIVSKDLNEYKIDLNLKASELYYYEEKIYLLGGYIEDEFSKSSSSNLYSIDLNEFVKTKIIKTKKVNEKLLH